MNRRSFTKSAVFLSVLSLSSYSVFKWVAINKKVKSGSYNSYRALIDELAETIIPRTDTPGAKDAQVGDYIINMLEFGLETRTQNCFLMGLKDLENYTLDTYKRSYMNCTKAERIAVLNHFEQSSIYSISVLNKIQKKFIAEPFIVTLKKLTVQGYCTSQIGATKGLAYDYVPGKFQPCLPLLPGQKAWATK